MNFGHPSDVIVNQKFEKFDNDPNPLQANSPFRPEEDEIIPQVHPRIRFLRRLYFLMFIQLGLIVFLSYLFRNISEINDGLNDISIYFSLIPLSIALLTITMVFFFRSKFSISPLNVLVYFFFTITMGFSCAWLVTFDKTALSFMMFISGACMTFSLLIYVLTTKTELTYQGASIYIIGAILLVLQLFIIFTTERFDYLIYCVIGEIVWGFYLVFDTQTIISGSKYDWNNDDSWSGAVLIYVDVAILIFRLCELIRQLIIRERN